MADRRTVPVDGAQRPAAPPPGWPLRVLEAVAGLLSAGVLLLGLVLLALIVLAPHLISGTGLSAASGPRWDRAGAQLLAGAVGEVLHGRRAGFAPGARPAAAAAAVLLSAAALWWGWGR